jgi:hypothetical protein
MLLVGLTERMLLTPMAASTRVPGGTLYQAVELPPDRRRDLLVTDCRGRFDT